MSRKRIRQHYFDGVESYERAYHRPYQYVVDDYIKNQFTQEQENVYANRHVVDQNDGPGLFYGFQHLDDSWNLMQERRLQSNMRNVERELATANQNVTELNEIEDYISDNDSLQSLQNKINELNDKIYIKELRGEIQTDEYAQLVRQRDKLMPEYQEKSAALNEKTEYYKTEGKGSENVRYLLFDADKADMNLAEVFHNALSAKGAWYVDNKSLGSVAYSLLNNAGYNAAYLVENLYDDLESVIDKALPYAPGKFYSGYAPGHFTRNYIAKTHPYDKSTDKWFVDFSDPDKTKEIRKKLREEQSYWGREKLQKQQEVRDIQAKLTNGTYYYNPNNIDPEFRQRVENKQYGPLGMLNPLNLPYSFVELGSSLSMMDGMFYSMATDAGIAFAVKKISSKLLGGPLAALSAAADVTKFANGAKAAETLMPLINAVDRAKDVTKNVDILGKALSIGSSIYFTKQMRLEETNNEAIDGWISRVMSESMARKINMGSVLKDIKQQLPMFGLDPTKYSDQDILEKGLVYGIHTTNKDFENVVNGSKQGLIELINKNNALAFMDYIEMLPFLSYQGSIFKNVFSKTPKLGVLPKYDKNGVITNLDKVQESWRYEQVLKQRPELLQAMEHPVRAYIDKKIEQAAKKVFKSPVKRKMFSDVGKFYTRKTSKLFPLAAKEGVEEGIQNIIQTQYERGFYDGYSQYESAFDIPSLFSDTKLGFDAVSMYIGGLFGDPDSDVRELMRAMEIGAVTAGWFRMPATIAKNALSQKQMKALSEYTRGFVNPEQDSFRNLLSQLKDDKILGRIVAEQSQNAQDDVHAGIFYDSLVRGRTPKQIRDTLEDYKNFKGPGVEDQYIDDDIKLLNVVNQQYSSDIAKEMQKKLGIQPNSAAQRVYVQAAADTIMKSHRAAEVANRDEKEESEAVSAFRQKIENYVTDILNGVFSGQLEDENDKGLVDFIQSIISDRNVMLDAEAERKANPDMNAIREQAMKNLGLSDNDLKLHGRTTLADRKKRNKNKEKLDAEINRILKEEYTVPEYDDRFDALKNYVLNVILGGQTNTSLGSQYTISYRFLRDMLRDRNNALSFIKKELGLPISTEFLAGVVKYLDEVYKKVSDEKYNIELKLQRELTDIMAANDLEMTEEMYKKHVDIIHSTAVLPNELKQIIARSILNTAVAVVLNTSAQAYVFGHGDPNLLRSRKRELNWSQLAREQKLVIIDGLSRDLGRTVSENEAKSLYSKNRREYHKKLNELRKEYNKIKNSEKDEDIQRAIDIEREAAQLFIKWDVQSKIDRSISAHYIRTSGSHELFSGLEEFKYNDPHSPFYNLKPRAQQQADERIDSTAGAQASEETKDPGMADETRENLHAQEDTSTVDTKQSDETPAPAADIPISEQEQRLRDAFGMPHVDSSSANTADETRENLHAQEDEAEVDQGPTKGDVVEKLSETGEDGSNAEESIPEAQNGDVLNDFGSNINDEVDEDEIDEVLSRKTKNAVADIYPTSDQESTPNFVRFRNTKQSDVSTSEQAYVDYLSRTLFYDPSDDTPPILEVAGTPIKLLDDATLQSPAELGRRLSKKGWFETTKKYFIIVARNHVDMTNPDSLGVCMIIQDGKDAFAVFMRGLAEEYGSDELINRAKPLRNRAEELKERLRWMHAKDEYKLPKDRQSDEYKQVQLRRAELYFQELNKVYENIEGDVYTGNSQKEWDQRKEMLAKWQTTHPDAVTQAQNRSRALASKPGKPVLTEEVIGQQIAALREARNAIIAACVEKDASGKYFLLADGYKIVRPAAQDLNISNGRFNNQEKDGAPVFRNLADTDAGVSSDIEELTLQIFRDEVRIGYGVGTRVEDESLVGAILNIDPTKNTTEAWDPNVAVGRAGKLYLIINGPSGNDTALQLREGRFYGDNRSIQPSDVEEAFDEDGTIKKGKTPSVAEFILRAITGTIDSKVFGETASDKIVQQLLQILVHNGRDTLYNGKQRQPWLSRKQLYYDSETGYLYIGIPANDDPSYSVQQVKIHINTLFGEKSSEELRKKIIAVIARNFHWNTEKDDMANSMQAKYDAVFSYLDGVFKNNDQYSFLGIKELTFNKSDFYHENGKKKQVSQIAWLIHTQRIMTDVGETVFKDPFVFVGGISTSTNAEAAKYNAALQQHNSPVKETEQPKTITTQTTPETKTRTVDDILKERSERKEAVEKIKNRRAVTYHQKIEELKKVYSGYWQTAQSDGYSLYLRVAEYFDKGSHSIAYTNYKTSTGREVKGLRAFGVQNDSSIIKQYFKSGGVGAEQLTENVISYLNSQGGEYVEYDFNEILDIIVTLFNSATKYPIYATQMFEVFDEIERSIEGEEDAEIDYISGRFVTDLNPTIQNSIEEQLDALQKKYGKEIRDKVEQQMGSAEEFLAAKGYSKISIINVRFTDTSLSDSQATEQLDNYLKNIDAPEYKSVNIRRLVNGEDILILIEKQDGTKKIIQNPASNLDNIIKNAGGISGVYSNKKGNGRLLDVDESINFLQTALGLSRSQIVITNAVLKSVSDTTVYGVTMLANAVLQGEAESVVIAMSSLGRRGMQYHEAFHVANLLLNDKESRKKIYAEFRKRNLFMARFSDKRIEEILAERFRKYASMRTDNTLPSKIKRFFSNILDFVFQSRKSTIIREMYDGILLGKYAGKKIDAESAKEFKKFYQDGAYMDVNIPGKKKEQLDKLKHIKDYKTFYAVGRSLAQCYIAYALDSNRKNTKLSDFLQMLDEYTFWVDDRGYIEDVLAHPGLFEDFIQTALKKYGFIGRVVKIKDDQIDSYDEMFDIDHFEMSAKDNVMYKAKLFLSTIPKYQMVDGKSKPEIDPYLYLNVYYTFDEAWTIATKELSSCESFSEILERTERLKDRSGFFNALYKKLIGASESGNIQIQNQVLTALRKQSPNLVFTKIGETRAQKIAKFKKTDQDGTDDSAATSDNIPSRREKLILNRERELSILDDNTLRATRSTLRSWSQKLYSSSVFKYSKNAKYNTISVQVVEQIKARYQSLVSNVIKTKSELGNLTKEQSDKKINDIVNELCLLLNDIGIEYDNVAMYVYLQRNLSVLQLGDKTALIKNIETFLGIKSNKSRKSKKQDGDETEVQEFGSIRSIIFGTLGQPPVDMHTGKPISAFSSPYGAIEFQRVYDGVGVKTMIYNLSKIYNLVHPNPRELSIKTPGGKLRYPTNENCATSDITRWLNNNHKQFIEELLSTPYAAHSNILKVANIVNNDFKLKDLLEFKLAVFTGMEDEQNGNNGDYHTISPLDDLINKMLFIHDDSIVFPTLADKKTFYILRLKAIANDHAGNKIAKDQFSLPKDILSLYGKDETGQTVKTRFSNDTLKMFADYFLDELDTLDQYYNRDVIKAIVSNPKLAYTNYHGEIENGRMKFGGNGGIFRYFYDLLYFTDGHKHIINLNQSLQAQYELQKAIENPESDDSINWLRDTDAEGNPLELDGFELVRRKLKEIRNLFFDENGVAKIELYNNINKMLLRKVEDAACVNLANMEYNFDAAQKPNGGGLTVGDMQVLEYGRFLVNRAIPQQIISYYEQKIKSSNKFTYAKTDINEAQTRRAEFVEEVNKKNIPETEKQKEIARYDNKNLNDVWQLHTDAVLSAVANYVVGQIISIIEVEKVFAGDPAFYKYKYLKDAKQTYTMKNPVSGDEIEVQTDILDEKDFDKIKRLGAILSPGNEIREDYSKEDLAKHPELRGSQYTIATLRDVEIESTYLKETILKFQKELLANYIRSHQTDSDIVTATESNLTTVQVVQSVLQYQTRLVSRANAELNKDTLYIFEDNLERTSEKVSGHVGKKSSYSKKYSKNGQALYYSKNKSEQLRGVENALPISTRLNKSNDQITDESLEEFKRSIDDEIATIKQYMATGKYKQVRFVVNNGSFLDTIENEDARNYLKSKLDVITKDFGSIQKDNIINTKINDVIDSIYDDDDYFNKVLDKIDSDVKQQIIKQSEESAKAYEDVNVADAEVLIRPAFYRKIRIGIGEWSTEPVDITYIGSDGLLHTTQYSDEIAYNILEGDANWTTDEELSAIVRKFEQYPLKMTYFQNLPTNITQTCKLAVPIYNKMAIFPVFKHVFSSNQGRRLYNRMNLENNEIDMLAFESAVKVGAKQEMLSLVRDGDPLYTLNDFLNSQSTIRIDKSTGAPASNSVTEKMINVGVQELSCLRKQLNTESHEDVMRNIGTQMFKILFSNLIPDEVYTFSDGSVYSGQQIRDNIMSYVNELTKCGVEDLKRKFYTPDGVTVDSEKVRKYIEQVLENNGVGATVVNIIRNGNSVSSITPRRLIEQSVAALVNRMVVDIPINGGSAIQQSVAGMISYDKNQILTQAEYDSTGSWVPNNGKDLKWCRSDNSMEVMLSLNFFRSVVPQAYQTTDGMMRQWLINHDYIAGFKKEIEVAPNTGQFLTDELDQDLVEWDIVDEPWKDDPKRKKRVLKVWLKGQREKGTFDVVAERDFEHNKKYTGDYAVHFKTNTGKYGDEDTEASTKEERSILFQQISKAIPYGARISTRGSVSIGGVHGLTRLGTESGWNTSASYRSAVSKETGEEIKLPIYQKQKKSGQDRYLKLSQEDEAKQNILNTELDNLDLDVFVSTIFKNAGLKTVYDIAKFKSWNEFKKYLKTKNASVSQQYIDTMLNELGISFGIEMPVAVREQSNPNPFGVGYRIPTQGMSSTFAFTVADVLPRNVGDLIIVPPEFTGQTGSDYDVDKIYIATRSFVNGMIDYKSTRNAARNKLIDTYIEILTNIKNFSQARASIDTVTNKIKGSILKKIRKSSGQYASSMYELTPHFQEQKKKEFHTGKDGIAPFALAITNHALVQHAMLTFDYGDNEFELSDLFTPTGRDGLYKSDWLSAMVNAHVDVAKDPYIFALNVNKATYSTASFLFRAGVGESTLLFLAQPALKEHSQYVLSKGGIYSGNLDYISSETLYDSQYLQKLINDYSKRVDEEFNRLYGNVLTTSNADITKAAAIKTLIDMLHSEKDVTWANVFSETRLNYGFQTDDTLQYLITQEFVLRSFKRLLPYSQQLEQLVQCSQVDTKKFGNDVPTHINFMNKLANFTNSTSNMFTLGRDTNNISAYEQDSKEALQHYFNSSYLADKLFSALNVYDDILKTQMIASTDAYKTAFVNVLRRVVGETDTGYKNIQSKDRIDAIGQAIDNIVRTQTLFNFAETMPADEEYNGNIDYTFNGDKIRVQKEIARLMFGDDTSEDPYEKNSLFANISSLIENITKDPRNENYTGLTDDTGLLDNALLKFLRPAPASDKNPIPKMMFSKFKIGLTETERSELASSFEFLLTHKTKEIRRLARDIALYAYYSTYDTGGASSFFDLVPLEFRTQYDTAIKTGLTGYNQGVKIDSSYIAELVCRNYYEDHKIVPLYKKHAIDSYRFEFFGQILPNTTVPGCIFTTFTDVSYIKMYDKLTKQYILYKRKYNVVVKSKTGSIKKVIPVYIPVNKYGLHSGNNHVYEFINSTGKSMFSQNNVINLPSAVVESYVARIKKDKGDVVTMQIYDPDVFEADAFKTQRQKVDLGRKQINTVVSDSTVVDDNAIMIDFYLSRETLLSQLYQISKSFNGDQTDSTPVNIQFIGQPSDIEVRRSDIEKYVDTQVRLYAQRLNENTTLAKRESLIKSYREKVQKFAEQNVTIQMYRQRMHETLMDIQRAGVVPDNIYVNVDDRSGKACLQMLCLDSDVSLEKITVISSQELTADDITSILEDYNIVLGDDEMLEKDEVDIVKEEIKEVQEQKQPEQPKQNKQNVQSVKSSSSNEAGELSSLKRNSSDTLDEINTSGSAGSYAPIDSSEKTTNDLIAQILANQRKQSQQKNYNTKINPATPEDINNSPEGTGTTNTQC